MKAILKSIRRKEVITSDFGSEGHRPAQIQSPPPVHVAAVRLLEDASIRYATFLALAGLITSRTPTPSLASISISASVLNKSIRPRSRSLMRGCVTRNTFAASACLSLLDVIAFCT